MASTTLFRLATRVARPASVASRVAVRSSLPVRTAPSTFVAANTFSTSSKRLSGGHEEETYEEFSARYVVIQLSFVLGLGGRSARRTTQAALLCHSGLAALIQTIYFAESGC